MENNKGQTIFLSVIGIATLLVAIVGATFAWFSANVSGTGSTMTVTTAYLGTIVFADGNTISETNWYPGDSETKTFTIAADASATVAVGYKISFIDVTNGFATKSDLVYSLSGTGNDNGGTLVSATNVQAPDAAGQIGSDGVLGVGETHSYTFTLLFIEISDDQNSNQGKSFTATLEVKPTEKYTAGGSVYPQ